MFNLLQIYKNPVLRYADVSMRKIPLPVKQLLIRMILPIERISTGYAVTSGYNQYCIETLSFRLNLNLAAFLTFFYCRRFRVQVGISAFQFSHGLLMTCFSNLFYFS